MQESNKCYLQHYARPALPDPTRPGPPAKSAHPRTTIPANPPGSEKKQLRRTNNMAEKAIQNAFKLQSVNSSSAGQQVLVDFAILSTVTRRTVRPSAKERHDKQTRC
jgi:hypothetical protein